jgi:hypothetical protein
LTNTLATPTFTTFNGSAATTVDIIDPSQTATQTMRGGISIPSITVGITEHLPSGAATEGTLAAAITAVGSGGTVVLPGTFSESIATTIDITSSVTIKCEKGAVIQQASSLTNAVIFDITASNVIFDGCTLDFNNVANSGSYSGVSVGEGTSGFTFRNGSIINSVNYGIRMDGTKNSTIENNYVNNPSGQFAEFFGNASQATTNAQVLDNKGVGGVAFQSPSGGGSTSSLIFSRNQLTPITSGTILTMQDASTGQASPLQNFVISDNVCTITGTTLSARPFGCYSLVSGNTYATTTKSNCIISNNVSNAVGQYVEDSIFELSVTGCEISNNTIYAGSDPGAQTYPGFEIYSGGNTYANNKCMGISTSGACYRVNTQEAADNNQILGGSVEAGSSFGYRISSTSVGTDYAASGTGTCTVSGGTYTSQGTCTATPDGSGGLTIAVLYAGQYSVAPTSITTSFTTTGTAATASVSQALSYGIDAACSNSTSLLNTQIYNFAVSGAVYYGLSLQGYGTTCPASYVVDNLQVSGVSSSELTPYAVHAYDATLDLGSVRSSDVTAVLGGSLITTETKSFINPISAPSVKLTNLLSTTGLATSSTGEIIAATASATYVIGSVTFTIPASSTAGWTRILSQSVAGQMSGTAEILQTYNGGTFDYLLDYNDSTEGGDSTLSLRNIGNYAGGPGQIEEIEVSSNGTNSAYLDIYTGSLTHALTVEIIFYGSGTSSSSIQTTPSVGTATPGTSSIASLNVWDMTVGSNLPAYATPNRIQAGSIQINNDATVVASIDGSGNFRNTQGIIIPSTVSGYTGTSNSKIALSAAPTFIGNVTLSTMSTPTTSTLTTATTGGTLTASTSYCYRVSAFNSLGSTIPSTESCLTTGSATSTNTITIPWSTIAGATSYSIYGRTTSAELLLASGITALTYTDTGSLTPSGAMPTTNTTQGSVIGSVTGSATSLSASSALPSGTTATTQTVGDDSTKVATTAYVYNANVLTTGANFNQYTFSADTTLAATTCYVYPLTLSSATTSSSASANWGNNTGSVVWQLPLVPRVASGEVEVGVCNTLASSVVISSGTVINVSIR